MQSAPATTETCRKNHPAACRTSLPINALGRSRGGLTTKTHLACEQGQKVLAMTAGQRGDSPQFIAVLREIHVARPGSGRPHIRPDLVLADKAYTSKGKSLYRSWSSRRVASSLRYPSM
jgi:hypothetical protein